MNFSPVRPPKGAEAFFLQYLHDLFANKARVAFLVGRPFGGKAFKLVEKPFNFDFLNKISWNIPLF